jgi:precorrin-2/cobalt-factor-2 C20-methyltransferase
MSIHDPDRPATNGNDAARVGRLFGVGVGPGDPELVTVKALRVLAECDVIAHFAAVGRESNARRIVADRLGPDRAELRLEYPVTTEALPHGVSYETLLIDFYDESAKRIAELLDDGVDVAVLCEGDPFFYGSYMYLHGRLSARYPTEVIPGVSSALSAASSISAPLVAGNETFVVVSGVLGADELERRMSDAGAFVVMKVGRNLAKVRDAITRAGRLEQAHYVEWATHPTQRTMPLSETHGIDAPYFSMVVVPSVAACR